jgi:hypothetical protein
LFLDSDLQPVLAQLSGVEVSFKDPEMDNIGDEGTVRHGPPPGMAVSLALGQLKSKVFSKGTF